VIQAEQKVQLKGQPRVQVKTAVSLLIKEPGKK
jgi:hypothetical protein